MHIEHLYSYTHSNRLPQALDRLTAAGFRKAETTARHTLGRRCGFLNMTGSYLEVIAIEDEAEFEAGATTDDRWLRTHPRPCGMAIAAHDPRFMYDCLHPSFSTMAEPVQRKRGDDPQGPVAWEFLYLPTVATPGIATFAVKYFQRPMQSYPLIMGENSVFALGGLMLCDTEPVARASEWHRTFALFAPDVRSAGNQLQWGVQAVTWWTPEQYQFLMHRPWISDATQSGATCAVRLFAQSVATAARCFAHAGFEVIQHHGDARLYIPPDEDTGYAFVIEAYEAEKLLRALG